MTRSPIETRPGYHHTLRQSVENPAQFDRLPADAKLSLEHRTCVVAGNDRRAVYLYFAWQVGWRVALLVAGKLLSFWRANVGNWYFALLILTGLVYCARGLLAQRSASRRWAVYVAACPFLALPAFLFDRPYYDLTLGMLALMILADRLATHRLFSDTCDLAPRPRLWQRLAWRNRFHLLDSPRRRVPFYLLAVAMPLGLLALILYRRQQPVTYMFGDDLVVLGWGLALGSVIAFLCEPLANFLFGQPVKGPLAQFRLARKTLWDWATYNLHNRSLPGIFTSPAGTVHARLDLLFGALMLLAVPLTELSFYPRLVYPGDDSTVAEPTEVALQPYQQAMLEKMSAAEREDFMNTLATEPEDRQEALIDRWFRFGEPRTQQQMNDQQIQISMLGLIVYTGSVAGKSLALLPPLLLLPVALLIGITPSLARAATIAEEAGGGESGHVTLDMHLWERFVGLLVKSPYKVERSSFFLGLNAADASPVIVPRAVFEEHAHFLGDSGSGKTTLGLAPLISQMIRSRDCSVVIIDLKGDDPALFENARIEAEHAGLKFRWFTNELGNATYVFNPLLQQHLSQLSLYQRTDLLTASLGLQYGTEYGRGFFSDANAELLYHALRAQPHVGSFVELSRILRQREPFRNVSAQLKMAGSHLAAIVTRLGSTEALNARPGPDLDPELLAQAIDMRQPFEEPQVVYFHLASALGTATSAEIARMAMFSLLSASKFVTGKRQQVFLIVDEFQRAVSNNLELFLQTARSMNIGVILANQSLSDLKKPGVDIVSTVRTNTRFRQIFAVGEMHDLQEIIFTSGETLIHGRSWNEALGFTLMGPGGVVRSRNTSELVSPRLRVNDLLLTSDHPLRSVCHVRRGDGYAQFGGMPFVMESSYHISPEEYVKRKTTAWPEQTAGTFTPTLASTDPVAYEAQPSMQSASEGSETQASAAAAKRLISGLDEHFEQQKAARQRAASSEPRADDKEEGK